MCSLVFRGTELGLNQDRLSPLSFDPRTQRLPVVKSSEPTTALL